MTTQRLLERGGPGRGRLGRHIEHDPRSRAFAFPTGCLPLALSTRRPATVRWRRRAPILNQGQLGSCVGNAVAGVIATDSAGRLGDFDVTEALAVSLYELATQLDDIAGAFPPDDTGSTGLGGMKAAEAMHYIASYQHAFSWRQVVAALQTGPAITGITWRAGCDEPDANGMIHWIGEDRGGHELVLSGIDLQRRVVVLDNSWGRDWGLAGSCEMPIEDYRAALADRGDVTIPVFA